MAPLPTNPCHTAGTKSVFHISAQALFNAKQKTEDAEQFLQQIAEILYSTSTGEEIRICKILGIAVAKHLVKESGLRCNAAITPDYAINYKDFLRYSNSTARSPKSGQVRWILDVDPWPQLKLENFSISRIRRIFEEFVDQS